MKLISWNVNGIRAIERKGNLKEFITKYSPDIFLIQETKAKKEQLKEFEITYQDYQQFYHEADKPGYSGTGIWIKKPIQKDLQFITQMPNYNDNEGRVSRVDFGKNTVLGVYFPNGGKSHDAWLDKLFFYDCFLDYINNLRKEGKNVIFTGDVNCAHNEIDLARPRENENHIGFLPEERTWISKVIKNNWIDVFRAKFPEQIIYSWWHLRTRARDRNIGWRLDYFFVDKIFLSKVKKIDYLTEQMGSDHCPILMEVDF